MISDRKGRPGIQDARCNRHSRFEIQDARFKDARFKSPKIVVGNRGLGMNSCILNGLNLASNSACQTTPFKSIPHRTGFRSPAEKEQSRSFSPAEDKKMVSLDVGSTRVDGRRALGYGADPFSVESSAG